MSAKITLNQTGYKCPPSDCDNLGFLFCPDIQQEILFHKAKFASNCHKKTFEEYANFIYALTNAGS